MNAASSNDKLEPWRRAALDLLAEINDERLNRVHGLEATRQMLELLARVMATSRRRTDAIVRRNSARS